jgi:hypothetical protein
MQRGICIIGGLAGGAGIRVGDQNVGRRSLSDIATAISDLQAAAMPLPA